MVRDYIKKAARTISGIAIALLILGIVLFLIDIFFSALLIGAALFIGSVIISMFKNKLEMEALQVNINPKIVELDQVRERNDIEFAQRLQQHEQQKAQIGQEYSAAHECALAVYNMQLNIRQNILNAKNKMDTISDEELEYLRTNILQSLETTKQILQIHLGDDNVLAKFSTIPQICKIIYTLTGKNPYSTRSKDGLITSLETTKQHIISSNIKDLINSINEIKEPTLPDLKGFAYNVAGINI